MSEVLGADVEAAEGLSRLMGETGQTFKDRAAALTTVLESVSWSGNYANNFRGDWNAATRQRLLDIAHMLDEAGARLGEAAQAQRQVSDGDGAVVGAGLAGAAAVAGTLAQGRRPRQQGVGPGQGAAGGAREERHYDFVDATVHIDNDDERRAVGRMADTYHQATGQRLTITDADRTPAEQADRVADTLDRGDRLIYNNRAAANELEQAYRRASAAPGSTPDSVRSAMTEVVRQQIGRGVYISDHLQGGAVDVRSNGMTDPAAFQRAAEAEGFRVVDERNRRAPHWHLEYDNPGQRR
jgi:hypothetical protein